jgi:hypothetical protein
MRVNQSHASLVSTLSPLRVHNLTLSPSHPLTVAFVSQSQTNYFTTQKAGWVTLSSVTTLTTSNNSKGWVGGVHRTSNLEFCHHTDDVKQHKRLGWWGPSYI